MAVMSVWWVCQPCNEWYVNVRSGLQNTPCTHRLVLLWISSPVHSFGTLWDCEVCCQYSPNASTYMWCCCTTFGLLLFWVFGCMFKGFGTRWSAIAFTFSLQSLCAACLAWSIGLLSSSMWGMLVVLWKVISMATSFDTDVSGMMIDVWQGGRYCTLKIMQSLASDHTNPRSRLSNQAKQCTHFRCFASAVRHVCEKV